MKILATKIRDVCSVISNRGLVSTIRLIWNQLSDRDFDKRYRTETSLCEDPRNKSSVQNIEHATLYVPTRARTFQKLLKHLAPDTDGTFVDYGCGKGRVLILAQEFGFTKVIGLEIVDEWARLSQKNLETCATPDRFQIISGDATMYLPEEKDKFFYFYDPFSDVVLLQCLDKIKTSLSSRPRSAIIVIHNNIREDWSAVLALLQPEFQNDIIELSGERFYVFRFIHLATSGQRGKDA